MALDSASELGRRASERRGLQSGVASAAGGARCWDGGEQEARGLKEGSGNSVRESRGLGEIGGNSVNAPGRRRRQGNGERWSDSHRRDEERLARLAGRRGKVGRELHGRGLNGAGCVGRGRSSSRLAGSGLPGRGPPRMSTAPGSGQRSAKLLARLCRVAAPRRRDKQSRANQLQRGVGRPLGRPWARRWRGAR